MTHKHQFYAWTKFQRRAVSMQDYFGYDLRFIPTFIRKKYLKPVDYIVKGLITVFLLLKHRPNIVWIQLPPAPLLYVVLLYKKIYSKSLLIIDCHNGTFYGKWRKHLNITQINKGNFIVVHNWVVRDMAINLGIDTNKLIILEDKPAQKNIDQMVVQETSERHRVLMPCGFAADEPLNIVFEAARYIPNIDILISGSNKRGISLFDYSKKPENVIFTGYLSLTDYETLFRQSDLVLGLTTENHIQLSVANEATGFEIPMVISDTELLRDLFNKGAVYVETFSADSIAAGIREALTKINVLRDEVKVLNIERNRRWSKMADALMQEIKGKRLIIVKTEKSNLIE